MKLRIKLRLTVTRLFGSLVLEIAFVKYLEFSSSKRLHYSSMLILISDIY